MPLPTFLWSGGDCFGLAFSGYIFWVVSNRRCRHVTCIFGFRRIRMDVVFDEERTMGSRVGLWFICPKSSLTFNVPNVHYKLMKTTLSRSALSFLSYFKLNTFFYFRSGDLSFRSEIVRCGVSIRSLIDHSDVCGEPDAGLCASSSPSLYLTAPLCRIIRGIYINRNIFWIIDLMSFKILKITY